MTEAKPDRVARDGQAWLVAEPDDVSWIVEPTSPGRRISAAVPPLFDDYATIVTPEDPQERVASGDALLQVLQRHTASQSWWLGYLETGVSGVVFPEARRCQLYYGWPYVVVQAGPSQAASWRTPEAALPWHSHLPELIWPLDRTWFSSELWDDDWRCIGAPTVLIDDLVGDQRLRARRVSPGEDATPPGHEAM